MIEGKFKKSSFKWISTVFGFLCGALITATAIHFLIQALESGILISVVIDCIVALVGVFIAVFAIVFLFVNKKAYLRIEGYKLDAKFALKAELHIQIKEIQSVKAGNEVLFLTVNRTEYQIQGLLNAQDICNFIVHKMNMKPEYNRNDYFYDKAEWQYESALENYCEARHLKSEEITDDFDDTVIWEMACNHILHFYTWLICNNMLSDSHYKDEAEVNELNLIKKREKTGFDFLMNFCDGCITEEDVMEEVLPFVKEYYSDNYLDDYSSIVPKELEACFSWEDYESIARLISENYTAWSHNKVESSVGLIGALDKSEDDLTIYLSDAYSIKKTDVKTATCQVCKNRGFYVFVNDTEDAVIIKCERCKTEKVILDGKDNWGEHNPIPASCPICRKDEGFNVKVGFVRKENGDAKWAYVGVRCCNCGAVGCLADWKIEKSPTIDIENNV